jgi:hypothetical protein
MNIPPFKHSCLLSFQNTDDSTKGRVTLSCPLFNAIKLFFSLSLTKYSRVFVNGESFVRKARANPVELPSGATIKGRLRALLANIRLGWKDLPGTNTFSLFDPLAVKRNNRTFYLYAVVACHFHPCPIFEGIVL